MRFVILNPASFRRQQMTIPLTETRPIAFVPPSLVDCLTGIQILTNSVRVVKNDQYDSAGRNRFDVLPLLLERL